MDRKVFVEFMLAIYMFIFNKASAGMSPADLNITESELLHLDILFGRLQRQNQIFRRETHACVKKNPWLPHVIKSICADGHILSTLRGHQSQSNDHDTMAKSVRENKKVKSTADNSGQAEKIIS